MYETEGSRSWAVPLCRKSLWRAPKLFAQDSTRCSASLLPRFTKRYTSRAAQWDAMRIYYARKGEMIAVVLFPFGH